MNSSEFGKLQNQKILNEGNYFVRQLNGKVKIDLIICYLKSIQYQYRIILGINTDISNLNTLQDKYIRESIRPNKSIYKTNITLSINDLYPYT